MICSSPEFVPVADQPGTHHLLCSCHEEDRPCTTTSIHLGCPAQLGPREGSHLRLLPLPLGRMFALPSCCTMGSLGLTE